MASVFRSNVLVREEKGFMNITFPRALSCLMMAGAGYFAMSKVWAMGSLCVSPAIFVIAVYLSGNRFGIMRLMWFFYDWKARFALSMKRNPDSSMAQAVSSIDLGEIGFNADELFATKKSIDVGALMGIQFLGDDENSGSGIQFLEDEVDLNAEDGESESSYGIR